MTTRSIDHVVMPVETLKQARSLLEALGFTVAPDARHPFGTGNACVFFADGTYIEPLAVLDRDLAENEAAGGNAFLRRDLSYRLRHPLPGFSGVALAGTDARADARAFAEAGFDGGDVLEFARRLERPDGSFADLAFRLAFAAERGASETFLFSCQRLSGIGSAVPAGHPNGATGIARIVYAADEPEASHAFLGGVLGDVVLANSLGTTIAAGNAMVDVLSADGLAARFGIGIGSATGGLRLAGLVIAVGDVGIVRAFAGRAGLPVREVLGRTVVVLSEAGGGFLAFEQAGARG